MHSSRIRAYIQRIKQQQQQQQPFNGLFSRTTCVSRYQKGKTNLDFTGARDSEWLWHQLGHTQVCTSLQTDNHASTPPLCFTGRMPFLTDNKTETKTKTVTGVLRCRRIQATAVDVCGCVSLDWPTRSARFYSTICVAAPSTWHRRSSTGPGMMIMIISLSTHPFLLNICFNRSQLRPLAPSMHRL